MSTRSYIAYYRVSTDRQGRSGLGLESQQRAVRDYLNGAGTELVEEYTEVESGRRNDRPELDRALAACELRQATLVIAKLDRLSRDARFLMELVDSGVDVVFCDLPEIPPGAMGRFMLQQMASVAELERGLISERTKAALARAKERGQSLGGYRGYTPTDADRAKAIRTKQEKARKRDDCLGKVIAELKATGVTSLRAIASALNERGIPAPRGGPWQANTVRRLLDRLPA